MTRTELLNKAIERTNIGAGNYGKPEDAFGTIASFWSTYLGTCLQPEDVCMMMILLKVARGQISPGIADTFVDIAGYAACAAEVEF